MTMLMLVISPVELDDLMHQGWPALASLAVDGWLVRLSEGVTQRANSVLPVSAPQDLIGALQRVELLYRDHGLAPTFQISPAAQPEDLDAVLADQGYELRSPMLVQVARINAVLRQLPASDVSVAIDEVPDEQWLGLWWSIDGRGEADAQAVARRLLTAGPALYASIRDSAGAAAVGRLALLDGWGGIYCMAVRQDARRRGYARAVLRALLEQASSRGSNAPGSRWLPTTVPPAPSTQGPGSPMPPATTTAPSRPKAEPSPLYDQRRSPPRDLRQSRKTAR